MSFAAKNFSYAVDQLGLVVIDVTTLPAEGGTAHKVLQSVGSSLEYYRARVRDRVVPNVNRLLAWFHDHGGTVVFTQLLVERDDASDWPPAYRDDVLALGLAPSRPGMPEFELLPELGREPSDLVVSKRSVSAFCATGLTEKLRARGVEHVMMAGCTTNFGVGISAIDAANQGFEVTLVDDSCATFSPDLHEAWLGMHELFFARSSTDAVLQKLADPDR